MTKIIGTQIVCIIMIASIFKQIISLILYKYNTVFSWKSGKYSSSTIVQHKFTVLYSNGVPTHENKKI